VFVIATFPKKEEDGKFDGFAAGCLSIKEGGGGDDNEEEEGDCKHVVYLNDGTRMAKEVQKLKRSSYHLEKKRRKGSNVIIAIVLVIK